MDKLTKEQRHKAMQSIHGKDTSIEILLRKVLWHQGYRFRKNYKKLPGTPDIVFTKYKIAIFCDSEFFHGKNWEILEQKLKSGENSEYWLKKITSNMARDEEINNQLTQAGWTVLRFWGQEIKKNLANCIRIIEEEISRNNEKR